MMIWDEYFARYQELRNSSVEDEEELARIEQTLIAKFIPHCSPSSPSDIAWFQEALTDQRKFFAGFMLEEPCTVPEVLYESMMRAAVNEHDPSNNRVFIRPCIATFGPRRVNETLLDWFEHGSDHEKAGAAQAIYWAGLVQMREPDWRLPAAAALISMRELWMRQRCVLLKEFVCNSNVRVRQCIIQHLDLKNGDSYPEEWRALVPEAIRIARNHEDRYIRDRTETQLGSGNTLACLPAMHTSDDLD